MSEPTLEETQFDFDGEGKNKKIKALKALIELGEELIERVENPPKATIDDLDLLVETSERENYLRPTRPTLEVAQVGHLG